MQWTGNTKTKFPVNFGCDLENVIEIAPDKIEQTILLTFIIRLDM